jgi:hypothetical protein
VHHLMLLFLMIHHLLKKFYQLVVLVKDLIPIVIPIHQRKQMIFRKNQSRLIINMPSFFYFLSCRLVEGYREIDKEANQSISEDDSKSIEQETTNS